jgi:predicted nucleic acid-binding protein
MFVVDSNVFIDVLTRDAVWLDWSARALGEAADQGQIFLNEIVFAEIAANFERIEDVHAALPAPTYALERIPFEAAFAAGQAFRLYRKRGGTRTAILSDFLIGAHAIVQGYALITRDAAIYRSYFPALKLIAPP